MLLTTENEEANINIKIKGELFNDVTNNTLIMMKARKVNFEIECKKGRWFVWTAQISGPIDPESGF